MVTYKDWHKMFSFSLHTFYAAVRTLMGTTLYFLVYRIKVVMPLEVEILSLRFLIDVELEEAEKAKVRYE